MTDRISIQTRRRVAHFPSNWVLQVRIFGPGDREHKARAAGALPYRGELASIFSLRIWLARVW